MIEKKFPRKLNKSADSRLLGADEMSDAINISTSEDSRGGGNAGVIKPIKSNTPLNEGFDAFSGTNRTVVGKAICDKYNVIYFFVYEEGGDSGIYAYDPDEYLPNSEGKNGITKVFSSQSLSYTQNDFVKADITYVQRNYVADNGSLYEDVPYIFFTDNNSQPKKINVLRAIEEDYDVNSVLDFTLVCPNTPQTPITSEIESESGGWENETEFNQNEFLGIEGFQFAYQNVYRDGSETALSAYSNIFVPPGYLRYTGSSDITYLNELNAIDILIPNDDMTSEVESVKLLGRRGNSGSWFVIEEFEYDATDSDILNRGGIEYRFLNTSVNTAVSNDVQTKQFDNVPVRAQAQTIIGNRLMYGNYVDGFDNVDVDADLVPIAKDRPEDFKSYELTVLPSVAPNPFDYDEALRDISYGGPEDESYGGARNKNIGFTIDASNLDEQTDQGSFISFSFTVNPQNNFHIYNAVEGYHQSPQMGEDFDKQGILNNGVATISNYNSVPNPPTVYSSSTVPTSSVTGHPGGVFWQNAKHSGAAFIADQYSKFAKVPAVCSKGVNGYRQDDGSMLGGSQFQWRYFNMTTESAGIGDYEDVDFGTSAGNPLIIQGKPFTVRCSFTAAKDLTKAEVVETIIRILSGETIADSIDTISVDDGSTGGVAGRPPTQVTEDSISNFADNISYPGDEDLGYEINLGLSNGSTFKETSPNAKLITMAGGLYGSTEVSNGIHVGGNPTAEGRFGPESAATYDNNPIKGFFIINKASVKFGIFHDKTYTEEKDLVAGQYLEGASQTISESKNKPRARFGIYVKEIEVPVDEEAVLSCARRPLPGARWWCFAPWNAAGNETIPAVEESVLFGNADFREYSMFPFFGGGGLMNNPGFPKGHNAQGGYPQEYMPGSDPDAGVEQNKFGLFDHPVEEMVIVMEAQIFKSLPDDSDIAVSYYTPPWESILGGLYYKPSFVTNYENRGETMKFHFGENIDGVPMYSLMDGKGGPGGSGVDSNSCYDNFDLPGISGGGSGDAGKGLGTLGSALVVASDLALSDNVPAEEAESSLAPPRGSGYGTAITNNIVFSKAYKSHSTSGGNVHRKSPSVELKNSSGQLTTISPFSGSNFNDPAYRWMQGTSTVPLIHIYDLATISIDTTGDDTWRNDKIYAHHVYDETRSSFPYQDNKSAYDKKLSNPNSINAVLSVIPPGLGGSQTFKAGANHAFGVVFYDDRGRASNVNPIGSVYIPWFGEREGGKEGAVSEIKATLSGPIPDGAAKYRFVYSGNTTINRFVQYSIANAFVSPEDGDEFSGNIYVSLNHLQQNKASFAKSYGARGIDGSQDIYTFREGDRLRIVSHYDGTESDTRIFAASDFEFNIVDQVVLGSGDDNPLYDVDQDGNLPHKAKVGSFLILENNLDATGFTYDQVVAGGNDPDSNQHNWNKRCVVEIYSPKDSADEENLVYYEIGPAYSVDDWGTEQSIVGGDSWWKVTPMNFQKDSTGSFTSIITENGSSPNFLPYNIESQSFSEKVRNSDVWGKGKAKIVLPDAERSVKSSSITYSDKDNPLSKIFSLTSFNPSKAQFKDLPPEFGDINYMINNDDSIFVIQSNRCSSVPVNRNLITDGGGENTLVAARQVLGTERYYAGNYGCDDNPESVCDIGNTIYFASKSNRQVYKFNPANGIQVVSDINMKSYFKRLFEKAEEDRDAGMGEIKVVGGYDPYNDSYVLSVYNQNTDEGTCGDNTFTGIDTGGSTGGGDVSTETTVQYVYPDSVTINLEDILERFSSKQLFDLAANTDGAITTSDLIDFLAVFGSEVDIPSSEQTFTDDEDTITFNFPGQ